MLINPTLTVLDDEHQLGMYEGCLSMPGLRGYVERPAKVKIEALNEKGEPVAFELEGYSAIVMQHEYDHLDGILYVDRITDYSRLGYDEEVQRFHDLGGDEDDDEE